MRRSRSIMALVLITTFVFLNTLAAQSINQTSYNYSEANTMVNNSANYINTINMSGYLIFSPNLTQSYSYLDKAYSILNTSPSTAVTYASLASDSAYFAYMQIGSYKEASLGAITIFTIIVAFMLHTQMRRVRTVKKGGRQKKKA